MLTIATCVISDPCRAHHCGVGHECDIDENENPVCVCKRECAEVNELRLQVSSNVHGWRVADHVDV